MYNQWTPVRPIFLQGETILVSPVLLNKTTITDCQTKENFAAIGISMLDLLMGFLLANRTFVDWEPHRCPANLKLGTWWNWTKHGKPCIVLASYEHGEFLTCLILSSLIMQVIISVVNLKLHLIHSHSVFHGVQWRLQLQIFPHQSSSTGYVCWRAETDGADLNSCQDYA